MPLLSAPPTALNSLPRISVPNTPKLLGGLGGLAILVGVVDIIGDLGANKWRDTLLGQVTGARRTDQTPYPNQNDLDGLPTNRLYEALRNDNQWVRPNDQSYTVQQLKELKFYPNDAAALADGHTLPNGVTILTYFKAVRPVGGVSAIQFGGTEVGTGFAPSEGLDFGAKDTKSPPSTKPIVPPIFSPAIGWGNGKPVTNGVGASLGIGNQQTSATGLKATPPPLSPPPSPVTNPPPTKEEEKRREEEKKPEEEKRREEQQKREEQRRIAPPPTPPVSGDTNRILQELIRIGAISALIRADTTPQAQRNNSKNGACDALNSPSCTKGFEDRIKDPLFGKLDAAQVARDGIAANQLREFANISENFTKVKNFLDNTIIDRAIGVANFAMNVHNALMLSNSLGRTLAGVVDTAMNLTPFRFTDATTGNPTTASRAFNSNVSSLIVNLIGQEQYTELTDTWKVANRIYQSSTNLLNKTERLLSGQSKVAQKSGIDIANIGNALRANGIVNPNSYPPMAATKEANTPTELLTDVNSPLSSIQSGIKNLNTVTKSVSGTLKQVSAIQKEFGKLQNLANKESKVRKSLRTQSAAQAKRKAKFTLLQIKTIKQTGKR